MLNFHVADKELYDEGKSVFINIKGRDIQIEHSLVSISKWESKWHKPFITKEPKTVEETIDYIKCMCITQHVDEKIFTVITNENIDTVSKYIADPMSATIINDINEKGSNSDTLTSEIIYYYMIAYNIPFECQKWHLNRLLNLIRICDIKNRPEKKMSRAEIMNRNRELNNKRRQELNSKG